MNLRTTGWGGVLPSWVVLFASFFCLPACQQRESPAPQNAAVSTGGQKREEDFRRKEQCAIAADRLDKLFRPSKGDSDVSISEAFYSSVRNSCVCEVTAFSPKEASSSLTLYDCLTREDLGSTLIQIGKSNYDQVLDAWKRKKDALKVASPTPSNPIR